MATERIVSPTGAAAADSVFLKVTTYSAAGESDSGRPECPLTHKNADLEDIARVFDMDKRVAEAYSRHGREGDQQREKAHADLTPDQQRWWYNGEEQASLPYSPAVGWTKQSVLPVTGGWILLHKQIQRAQEKRKKSAATDEDEDGRREEQPEDRR